MKRLFIFTTLLIGLLPLQAQEPMTLHECMQYAIDHSPKTKIQELTNDSRRLDHRDAYLNMIPSIDASVNGYTSFGRSIDPETNTYTNTSSFSNSYSLNGSFYIFNGFAIVDKIRVAKVARLTGVSELQQVEDNVCLSVIQAFYNVLYQQGMVDLCQKKLEDSQNQLRQGKIQEELGLKGYADVLQLESQVAENDYNYVHAQNVLKTNVITLKEAMFFPSEEELVLDNQYVQLADPFIFNESADSLYQNALYNNPKAQIAAFDVQSAKISFHNAKWSLLPSLYTNANYNSGYITGLGAAANKVEPFWTQMKNLQGQSISVGMSIPLFGGLSKQSNIARKRNSLRIAEAKRDQTNKELESEINRAVQDMIGSAKEFVQSNKRVLAQEQAYLANQRKYEEGLISVIELHTSANQDLSAKAELLNATFTYLVRRHIVNYYKGTPYINQEF